MTYQGPVTYKEFIVVCNACNSEICPHYPIEVSIRGSKYPSPGTKVLRRDGKMFEEAIINENGYIEYKNEIK